MKQYRIKKDAHRLQTIVLCNFHLVWEVIAQSAFPQGTGNNLCNPNVMAMESTYQVGKQ